MAASVVCGIDAGSSKYLTKSERVRQARLHDRGELPHLTTVRGLLRGRLRTRPTAPRRLRRLLAKEGPRPGGNGFSGSAISRAGLGSKLDPGDACRRLV